MSSCRKTLIDVICDGFIKVFYLNVGIAHLGKITGIIMLEVMVLIKNTRSMSHISTITRR